MFFGLPGSRFSTSFLNLPLPCSILAGDGEIPGLTLRFKQGHG